MCKFDYAKLTCKAGDDAECLTKGQVESAKAMTTPLRDPKTGKALFEGHLMPGSELGWGTLGGPQPLGLSISGMQNVVFKDKNWDYHSLNMSADGLSATGLIGGYRDWRELYAENTFAQNGGEQGAHAVDAEEEHVDVTRGPFHHVK